MATGDVVYNEYVSPGGGRFDAALAGDKTRALVTVNGGMRYREAVRQSMMWATMATSAVAALVVRPTTTAALELFNGYPAGGPSLVIDRLFTQNLVATAVNSNAGIWAMVTAVKTAPSTASLAVVGGHGTTYGGAVIPAVGTTVIANGWFPFGPNYNAPSAAAPGGSWEALLEGRLIVPQGCSLCLHVVGSIVGDTYCSGASWTEEALDLVFP